MRTDSQQAIVGGSLIGAGALLIGIGTAPILERTLSLSIVGASLITAGLTYLLATAAISSRQRIAIGAVLTAAGTTVAVFGTTLDSNTIAVAVALTGGSLMTAGVIQTFQAAASRQHQANTAP